MIIKKITKKLWIIILSLITVFLILMFPEKNETKITISNNINYEYIYLLDNYNYLSKVKIVYQSTTLENKIKEIINILTINTSTNNTLKEGFKGTIPSNTKLLSISINNKIITLNFNDYFINTTIEKLNNTLTSLTYSLTELENIDGIIIKVNDKELTDFKSIKIKYPLTRDIKINKDININNLNNIQEITVYYNAIYKDFSYSIPVTKYENNKKEKIEIIIDELKSNTTSNNNLVNYISNETMLINYEILSDTAILNFNEKLFSNLKEENIIESIAYSINDSIKENYNIKNIIYYINNKPYKSYFLPRG